MILPLPAQFRVFFPACARLILQSGAISLFLLAGCGGGGGSNSAVAVPTATPIAGAASTLRVACVGDSITAGVGVPDAATQSYPAVLGQLLGEKYQVSNYGLSGATLLINTGLPYQKSSNYQAALAAKADIVTVALGTNDATLSFSAAVRASFVKDYGQLIADFRRARPDVRLYLCIPPAAYGGSLGRVLTIRTTIAPLVRQIAADNGAQVIDLFSVTQGQPALFPDSLHPNEAGARVIAAEIARVVRLP